MFAYLLAVSIGFVAGLRTMTAPTAVSWAAYLGWLNLNGSPVAFMGHTWTPWVLTVLAIGEFIADQLPTTPSRKVPAQFGARILSGALCGATLGFVAGSLVIGAIAGVVGAILGTLGGHAARSALAKRFGSDRPAAYIEDAVAIAAALSIVAAFA
jgi:uncharacterized membrane protein